MSKLITNTGGSPMSNLITNTGGSPIQPAFDTYWDKPMTRREAHKLFVKLASNDNELMGMADTAAILINFICEKKLGMVDRSEVESYIKMKTEQLKAQRAKMQAVSIGENPEAAATTEATQNAQPNS